MSTDMFPDDAIQYLIDHHHCDHEKGVCRLTSPSSPPEDEDSPDERQDR